MGEVSSSYDPSVSADCPVYLYVSTLENELDECLAVLLPLFSLHMAQYLTQSGGSENIHGVME